VIGRFATIPNVLMQHDSGKALLFFFKDKNDELWTPRTQTDRLYPIGYEGTVRITHWWLKFKGKEYLAAPAPPPESKPEHVVITADDLPNAAALRRRLSVKYHPDLIGGNGEMMKDINQLWQVMLSDLRGNAK
jgi:hypothetical protein